VGRRLVGIAIRLSRGATHLEATRGNIEQVYPLGGDTVSNAVAICIEPDIPYVCVVIVAVHGGAGPVAVGVEGDIAEGWVRVVAVS
jgi:hypothetical protein